jgi:hypothetical protein
MSDSRVTNDEPVGKVAFPFDNPDDGVKKGASFASSWTCPGLVREHQRQREKMVFSRGQISGSGQKSRCVIND